MSGEAAHFLGQLLDANPYERIERVTWYYSGSTKGWRHHCPVCGPSSEAQWDEVLDIQQRHRYHGVRPPGGHPKRRTEGLWPRRRIPDRQPAKVRR